jgi:RNA polymerase sigma-70 factor (ECF subfamily)
METPGTGTETAESSCTARWFATTHWSVVLNAQEADSPQAAQALEQLCRTYWYPLYAYVRRQGRSPEDAQDLTQAFFARLLAGSSLGSVDRRKGRFRSFLLAAMNHFLAEEWHRAHRQKRGGGQTILSLDEATAEERYRLEPAEAMTAETIYERRWALTLLEQVLRRLETEFAQAGQTAQFEVLKTFLLGDKGELSYADAAARTGLSESAVGVAIHRMRRRYGELFRETIAHTVADPAEVDEEIAYLLRILGA